MPPSTKRISSIEVDATFRDKEQHFYFRRTYGSKAAFLRALSRSNKAYLVQAVDITRLVTIRNDNLEEYRRMK